MAGLGAKKVGQIASFGGKGVGQLLAAAAVALLIRLFSGPGPALPPEDDEPGRPGGGGGDGGEPPGGEAPADGGVVRPVTIRWRSITCSLSDKSSGSVSRMFRQFLELSHALSECES